MERRPRGVTAVSVISAVVGALQILTGALLLFGGAALAGSLILLVGVLTWIVTVGLFRGSNGARLFVTIVLLLNVGSAIYILLAHPAQLWSAVLGVLFAVIGIALLFSTKANAYFDR
ncbi:hypothetical protein [Microbacterium sp.]|uniref:hypothetical protein n=1 Tax=Microbacterium sp. TaxID=51671 RepID=UPI0009270EE0|nr:hypothetical protein [Microbacterium sp.]MBN9190186.1 hypothetical protein [Microbacterium sp.]MBN9194097.1 hypothetical protein [Microbacterium sp.]OJU59901.1 MAG: hypothetical protein BGO04_03615 [Microbacterium sp. 70-38]